MGQGGEANHELGISYRDINNSGRRAVSDQYESHNTWSRKYMWERISGIGLALTSFLVFTVWLIETPSHVRYGVSGGAFFLLVIWAFLMIGGRKKLKKIRAHQLKEFRQRQGKPDV